MVFTIIHWAFSDHSWLCVLSQVFFWHVFIFVLQVGTSDTWETFNGCSKIKWFFPPTLLSTQFILFLCRMFMFQRKHWCFLVDCLYSSMINPSSGSSLGVFAEHFDNISYFCPQTSRYRSLWGKLGVLYQISCSEFGFFLIVVSLVHEFLKGSIYIPSCLFFSHCGLPIVFQCTTLFLTCFLMQAPIHDYFSFLSVLRTPCYLGISVTCYRVIDCVAMW